MSKKCPIMKRMKDKYENRAKHKLTCGIPVIIRLDGKAFHTYTRGLDKPFDEGLIQDMQNTAIELCKQIQGAKCAYTQSDEISILVTDYDTIDTMAWFDYDLQKIVSITASIATSKFNLLRIDRLAGNWVNSKCYDQLYTTDYKLSITYVDWLEFKLAHFDSRAFNIPTSDVANYFLARQRDAVKNSIQMLAQSLYSHKELDCKNQSDLQEMCFQKGHNWNDLSCYKKRGSWIVKGENGWHLAEETPMKFDSDLFKDMI